MSAPRKAATLPVPIGLALLGFGVKLALLVAHEGPNPRAGSRVATATDLTRAGR